MLLIDSFDKIWLHDADTKCMIVFNSDLQEVKRFEGNSIVLCKDSISLDYQEDMVFSANKDLCLWYKGLGNFLLINV